MDLLDFSTNVFRTASRPGQDRPMLELLFTLRCLMCGEPVQERTNSVPLVESSDISSPDYWAGPGKTFVPRVDGLLSQVAQSRNCQRCGMYSALPAEHKRRLKVWAEKTITPEWIKAQIDTGIPPYSAMQKDLFDIKTQIDRMVHLGFQKEGEQLIRQIQETAANAIEQIKAAQQPQAKKPRSKPGK